MKITLEKLNEAAWYRAIKVFFVLLLAGVSLINFSITKDGASYDYNYNYTRITCQTGTNEATEEIRKSKLGISSETSSLLTSEKQEILGEICGIPETMSEPFINGPCPYTDKSGYLSCNSGFIASEGVMKYNFLDHMMHFLGYELIILAVLETLRRVFYYVATGTFRPKK